MGTHIKNILDRNGNFGQKFKFRTKIVIQDKYINVYFWQKQKFWTKVEILDKSKIFDK